MLTTSRSWWIVVVLILVIAMLGAAQSFAGHEVVAAPMDASDQYQVPGSAYFAKYEGIDGEATDGNHLKWIDVTAVEWGVHEPEQASESQGRSQGQVVVDDMTITALYEKAMPKILEKSVRGEVIPRLEIELVTAFGTYLRYELTNVRVTGYSVSGNAASGMPPTVTISNSFEQIKVTYTEYDDEGNSKGNVETQFQVGPGRR